MSRSVPAARSADAAERSGSADRCNQSEGKPGADAPEIRQISMHSKLIYSAFDPRFNVYRCHLFDSGGGRRREAGRRGWPEDDEILLPMVCTGMGMAENGFRQLTNGVRPVHSGGRYEEPESAWAGSNLLMKCCMSCWGRCDQHELVRETTALQQGTVDGQENLPYD